MKTILFKSLALCAALIGSSFVFAEDPNNENWNVNDSVVVKKSTTHYLTGEEPSTWVYERQHSIQQVGSKRFEEGILLREAYSWVGADDVTLADGTPLNGGAANGGQDKNANKHYSISDWHVGDTIMIKPETKHYLTGEEPSTWVYDREHTIQAIGSNRFPEGILVKGIISWVGPDDIYSPNRQPQDVKPAETTPADQGGNAGETNEGDDQGQTGNEGQTGSEGQDNGGDDNGGQTGEVGGDEGGGDRQRVLALQPGQHHRGEQVGA